MIDVLESKKKNDYINYKLGAEFKKFGISFTKRKYTIMIIIISKPKQVKSMRNDGFN